MSINPSSSRITVFLKKGPINIDANLRQINRKLPQANNARNENNNRNVDLSQTNSITSFLKKDSNNIDANNNDANNIVANNRNVELSQTNSIMSFLKKDSNNRNVELPQTYSSLVASAMAQVRTPQNVVDAENLPTPEVSDITYDE